MLHELCGYDAAALVEGWSWQAPLLQLLVFGCKPGWFPKLALEVIVGTIVYTLFLIGYVVVSCIGEGIT